MQQLLQHCQQQAIPISQVMLENEKAWRSEAEIPLADEGRVVTGRVEVIREGRHLGIEVTPGVRRLGADKAGHAHAVRVATAHERRAGRRAERRGVEIVVT